MKRSDLNLQLTEIKNKITELKKLKFRYFIHGKYIDNFGSIQLIENLETLTNAFAFVKSKFNTVEDTEDLENELGIKKSSKEKEVEEQVYLGYTLEEWTEEFKMKAQEIQNTNAIEKLEKALKKLKSYRTEDEKFEEDANKFSDLFAELGIDVSKKIASEIPNI